MLVDPASLQAIIQTLGTVTAPFTAPFLDRLGRNAADKLTEAITKEFGDDPDAKNILEQYQHDPTNAVLREQLYNELEKRTTADREFAKQLVELSKPLNIDNSRRVADSIVINQYFYPASPPQPVPTPPTQHPNRKTKKTRKKRTQHRPVFQLNPAANSFEETGKNWRFFAGDTDPDIFSIINGVLHIGGGSPNLAWASAQLDTPRLKNVGVELEMCLEADAGNSDNWAGVRVRGITPFQEAGYLIYLRSSGNIDLFSALDQLVVKPKAVANPMNKWVKMKLELTDNVARVWLDDSRKPLIEKRVNYCNFSGSVYLHVFCAKAKFRNLVVYAIESN